MRILFFAPAVTSLIISVILLTLPANDLPHSGLFDLPNFDKLVHFGMFFLLTVLFCLPFYKLTAEPSSLPVIFNKIALYVILYGIIMELVQKYFTTGRSFDFADILFDGLGSLTGLIAVRRFALKK